MYVPQSVFLTKGVGKSKEQLTSFEMALRNASMAPFNLVSVSSIYPAGCKLISKERGLKKLASGQIVHAVYSNCLLYTSPSPRDRTRSRMPSSA